MGKDNDNNAERYGTHPHAYKQLLVGWIVGGMAVVMTGGSNEGGA